MTLKICVSLTLGAILAAQPNPYQVLTNHFKLPEGSDDRIDCGNRYRSRRP